MKKLALLFLVLPIPAFASDLSDLKMQQATEARTVCVGKNIAPESKSYADCVNDFLQSRYRWKVVRLADGSLGSFPAGSFSPGPPASVNNVPQSSPGPAFGSGFR